MGNWFGGSASGPRAEAVQRRDRKCSWTCSRCLLVSWRRRPFERGFALLLCNSRIGLGNEGFDLDELPWSADWEAERAFLLRVIELAQAHFHWELLSYEPPYADRYLAEYAEVVRSYRPPSEAVDLPRMWDPSPVDAAFTRCPKHGLYLGDYTDCRLCP